MELRVDPIQRYAKTRAHTATHLLHAELAAIFPQTKQAGSLVDEDYLRFDFYSDVLLTDDQLATIQSHINAVINQALPVTTQELSYDDAIKAGAKAFFEDKYGDIVRVVSIGDKLSVELCGGTHASNTKDIGAFTIISQEAVASGVKRIIAVTGPKVVDELTTKNTELKKIAQLLGVQEKQIIDKTSSLNNERKKIKKERENIANGYIDLYLENLKQLGEIKKIQSYQIINTEIDDIINDFKFIVEKLKQENTPMIVHNNLGNYAIIDPNGQAKTFAQSHNLRGGGSDQLFQGKDPAILALFPQ